VDGALGTVPNTAGATFAQDFQGDLSLVNFQNATVQVARDFAGTLTARTPGDVQLVHVGRTLTTDGVLHATGTVDQLIVGTNLDGQARVDDDLNLMTVGALVNDAPVPGNVTGLVQVGHDLGLGNVYGSVSGLITVGNDVTSLLKVFGDTSGVILVTRDVGDLDVLGSLSGTFGAGRNVTNLEVGTAITGTGTVVIGGDLFSLHAGTVFGDPYQGLFGQVVVGGSLNQAEVDGIMSGTLAVQGDIGAEVIGADGSPTRFGSITVGGSFDGQIVAMGNAYGDLVFKQDFNGRVAVHGQLVPRQPVPPFGIVGNVEVAGSIGSAGAIVSGGLLGDAAGGTALSAGGLAGLLAARGDISFGSVGEPDGAHIFEDAAGVNAAAIDAVFTDGGKLLVIDTTPQGLHNLSLILADLAALSVGPDGNLTGPIP
jgi:hypothetical protein